MIPITEKSIFFDPQNEAIEKPKSCSFGRVFTKVLGVVGQVAKVALLALAVVPVAAQLPRTAIYMNPGQMLTRAGTASCGTNGRFFTYEKCQEFATSLFSEYHFNASNPLKFTEAEINGRHEKGIARSAIVECEIRTSFRFFIPQNRFTNYEKALKYAQWAFVDDPSVFSQGHDKIISSLKKIHGIIVAHETTAKGEYRKAHKVINPNNHHDNAQLEWQDKNLSPEELVILQRTNNAFNDANSFRKLTKDELDLWEKVVHIPISECLIESEMNTFIQQFCCRMQKGGNYIEHAAFFHQELTRISPFGSGVGRLARLMTNVILIIGEHTPVVYADHREYTKAVRDGTFAEYLGLELAKTKAQKLPLEDPTYRRIIDESLVMCPGKVLQNVGRESVVNDRIEKFDQKRYFNYQRAVSYVRQHPLAQLTSIELIKLIKETQVLLEQNLEQEEPYILGQYRKSYMIVDGIGDPYQLIARIQERFYGPDLKEFFDSYNEVLRDVTHLGRLSKREKELWYEIAHIPCAPNEIEQQMATFTEVLERELKDPSMSQLELASFVHMSFARIWAYQDANGRLARLFMNEILHMHAMPFITFPSEIDYFRAVHSALYDHKIFSRYLESIAR
jgi:Fic family protein